MLNTVILHGRLTRNPATTATKSGGKVANLRLAVPRPKSDGKDQGADFVDVVCFGTTAENAAKYLTKGRGVLVNGRLHLNQWTDTDGQNRQRLEVIANQLEFLPDAKTTATAAGNRQSDNAAGEDQATSEESGEVAEFAI